MRKFRHDIEARSVAQYARLFESRGVLRPSDPQWYRGEGRSRQRRALLPSIARKPPRVGEEWAIYQRFRPSAAAFLPHANLAPWDWMLYMRHYGEYTRLLDCSESALVALYFAVEDMHAEGFDGVVWCLDPLRLNDLAGHGRRIHCAGLDTELDYYTIESVHASTDAVAYAPVALIAQRSFPRLIAQQGVFTVTHRQQVALDEIGEPELLARVRIPSAAKAEVRASLKALGMTRLSLFPELQSLAARD